MTPAPRLLSWLLRRFGKVAITLPPWGIYYVPGALVGPRLTKHEAAHWAQYERMGLVRFYATYLWLTMRHGYRQNPMEVEARAAEMA